MKKSLIFTLALSAAMFLGLGNANAAIDIKANTEKIPCVDVSADADGFDKKCPITFVFTESTSKNLVKGLKFNFSINEIKGYTTTSTKYKIEGVNGWELNADKEELIANLPNEITATYTADSKDVTEIDDNTIAYVYFDDDDARAETDPDYECGVLFGNPSDLVEPKCDILKDGIYIGPDGTQITKEEYDKLCGSNNYKDGYGNPYVIIGLGAALIAGVVFVTKKNKVLN